MLCRVVKFLHPGCFGWGGRLDWVMGRVPLLCGRGAVEFVSLSHITQFIQYQLPQLFPASFPN